MAKVRLKLVTPATVNRTVTPRRPPNGKLRTREYLTEAEVEGLMEAAKGIKRKGWREKERGAALFVVLPTNCLTRLIATAKHRPLLRQLPST